MYCLCPPGRTATRLIILYYQEYAAGYCCAIHPGSPLAGGATRNPPLPFVILIEDRSLLDASSCVPILYAGAYQQMVDRHRRRAWLWKYYINTGMYVWDNPAPAQLKTMPLVPVPGITDSRFPNCTTVQYSTVPYYIAYIQY